MVGEPCDFPTCGEPGDCAQGLACWGGFCHELCEPVNGGNDAKCADPLSFCMFAANSSTHVCSIPCDPLNDTCPEGMSCQLGLGSSDPYLTLPACAPAQGSGAYGEPCVPQYDACDPGLVCLSSDVMPETLCSGMDYCCSSYCDLTAPQCPDAALGIECVPVYEPGQAPPGLENLGICMLPP